ncbi:hypothetical protein AC1031_010856 [Aphanomyces cochlioides]|nr:hypothetical protein AC1031_010856 [Aphanomyces cochlioides]
MYSSYSKAPKSNDHGKNHVATDHEALHRDAAVHKSVQSSENHLTPLDLETIFSNKGVVKYWYLHRPKTMEIVHRNAVKVQSVGRSFAVRQLIKKYGINYMVELAKRDAEKKEAERLAEMSAEERLREEQERIAFDAKVEETRRLKRERDAAALAEEQAAREAEAARLAQLEEERREREAREAREREEAEAAAAAAAATAAAAAATTAATTADASESIATEQSHAAADAAVDAVSPAGANTQADAGAIDSDAAWASADAKVHADADAAAAAAMAAVASTEAAHQAVLDEAAALEREAEERELAKARALAEKAALEAELARQAEKQAKYEESLAKDVPVVVTEHGRGRVLFYDREAEVYSVAIEHYGKPEEVLEVYPDELVVDGERILSPRTLVDTPFGTGEIIGLDPHLGCYAVTNLNVREDHDETTPAKAYLQIRDVVRHREERESHDVVVDAALPIPEEITMKSARIVNSKIVTRGSQKFVQYQLEIQTTNYGTVYCWKRYSTFRALCDRLQKEAGYKKKDIPELPKRHIMGNLTEKTVLERVHKLNEFLDASVRAEHLQWGIKVDDRIAVYKRRVKKPRSGVPSTPVHATTSSRRR